MKKTLWIIDHYSSEPKYGGYTRQYNYAKGIAEYGYHVVVIASSFSHFTHKYIADDEYNISEISDNIHYIYLRTTQYLTNDSPKRFLGMLSFARQINKYKKVIERQFGKPDWIVASSPHPITWIIGNKIAVKYCASYNIEIRDFWPLELRKSKDSLPRKMLYFCFDLIETWALKKANHIICTLPYGGNYCIDTGKSGKEKFTYIGQPIDCTYYDKCAEKNENLLFDEIQKFIEDSFYCVFSGYYMKYEGVYQMLHAAYELEKEGWPIKFVFVGSGEEKESMQKFVNNNCMKNVYIGERIKKEAIPALLKHSNVCLAYLHELEYPEMFKYGMSKNKINEYLYSGAITIMGFADSRNEITDSNGGYTFEPEHNKFAELIKKVYQMDEDERKRFGENARQYIDKTHNIKILAKKYIEEVLQ